jgi:hypothetical protein
MPNVVCIPLNRCCHGRPLHCTASAQAQRHSEAAKLLVDAAEQLASRQAPPLQIKKLYVLAALEVEAFKKKTMEDGVAGAEAAQSGRAAGSSVLTGGKKGAGAANTLAGEGTACAVGRCSCSSMQRAITCWVAGGLEPMPTTSAHNLQPSRCRLYACQASSTSNQFLVQCHTA